MGLKEQLDNNPTLIVLGVLLAGFLAGVGTMTFLEGREKKLRATILAELKQENEKLKVNNEELDKSVRNILVKYVNTEAILKGAPLGGENSEVRKLRTEILQADKGEISKIIRDPTRFVDKRLGF